MQVNMTELTDIFGYAYNTLNAATKDEPPLPVADRPGKGRAATFDTVAVHKYFVEREVRRALEKTAGGSQIEELRAAKLAEEVETRKMQNAVTRGELVNADEIATAMSTLIIGGREYLRRTTPQRIARRLIGESDPTTIAKVVKDEVENALREWNEGVIIDLIEDEGGKATIHWHTDECPLCGHVNADGEAAA
jgi:phage terminase Nu1 subunit (DNA packaging protein)